jgi:hypothetical protein
MNICNNYRRIPGSKRESGFSGSPSLFLEILSLNQMVLPDLQIKKFIEEKINPLGSPDLKGDLSGDLSGVLSGENEAEIVIPVKTGIQFYSFVFFPWIPIFIGMTNGAHRSPPLNESATGGGMASGAVPTCQERMKRRSSFL